MKITLIVCSYLVKYIIKIFENERKLKANNY